MSKGFKIGLALGGGAARALAQIGVIEALERQRIPIDIITGTSMGAIIGSIYAVRPDVSALKERIFAYLDSEEFRDSKFDFMVEKDIFEGQGLFLRFSNLARKGIFYTRSMTRRAFVSEAIARRNFEFLVDDLAIEDTRIPFAATALDLISGEEVLLDRGRLREAVAATCALPGILHPVHVDGRVLVDGGWINAVPVEPAYRMGADFVIAVDVSNAIRSFEESENALEIIFRADAITRHALSEIQIAKADFVLRPAMKKTHWADFSETAELIRKGVEAVDSQIVQIRKEIGRQRVKAFLGLGRRGLG